MLNKIPSQRADTRTTTNDDGRFIRHAVIVNRDQTESIDIVDHTGRLLMRLNISNHDDGSKSIDVIGDPATNSEYCVQSWYQGERIMHNNLHASLVAVVIK